MKKKSPLMKKNLLNFLTAINNPKTSVYWYDHMSFWGKFQNKCLMTSVMDLYLALEILSGLRVQNPCIDKSFDPWGAYFPIYPSSWQCILTIKFWSWTFRNWLPPKPSKVGGKGRRYFCHIPVIAKKIRVVTHQLSYISSSVFSMHKSCFLHLGAFRIQTTSNELRWNKMSY